MALPTDIATVAIDHGLEKPRPGQLDATSPMPLNVTVEDYTSDEKAVPKSRQQYERMNAIKKDVNETKENQRKSTVRVSTLPKQTNVSWFDEPVSQKSQTSSHESRISRVSQATTAVPPSPEPLGRPPIGKSRTIDPKAVYVDQPYRPDPAPKVRTSRRSEVRWVDDDYYTTSESAEDENWYHRREPRRSSTNNLPPGPTPYIQPINKAPQTSNYNTEEMQHPESFRYFEPRNMYPEHSRYLGHDAPPASYQSWPYPYQYEHPGTHAAYRSILRDDLIYPGPYSNRRITPWNHGRHLLPPPRPLRPSIKPTTKSGSNSLAVTKLVPAETDAQHKETDTKEGVWMSEKLEEMLQKYQQAFEQHNEAQRKITTVEEVKSASTSTVNGYELLTDMDIVQLMGERMLDLKRKNEEKLIEANQVLKYLEQSSHSEQGNNDGQGSSNHIQGARPNYGRMPTVYQFRASEEKPDHEDTDRTSANSDRDSIAGNSSGSSASSLAPIYHQVRPLPAIAGRQCDRRTHLDSVNFDDDESISSTEPERKSTVSGVEPESSNLRATESAVDGDSFHDVVKSAEMLATEVDMMGELIALRRDLSILKRQTVQGDGNWLVPITRPFITHLRRYFRHMPRPGTQRLEWTCECGEDMYADLSIRNGAQYQQMLEFLTRSGTRTHQTNPDQRTPSQLEGGTNPTDYPSLQSSQSSLGKGPSPASTIGSGSTYVGTASSQILTAQGNDAFGQSKYLELCINTSKYETKLAEIQVLSGQSVGTAICTDGHLFRHINQRYYALRKQTWRRFLYRPAGIKFVHFGVQAGERVSFFSSDPLPPEDEIAAKRYEYNPQPPVPPPMDSRTFLHYFHKHSAHTHSTSAKYVNRLPKKLGESLSRSLGVDDLLEGWGIHIIEGPNKVAICWALFFVLVASLAVSIVYDYLTRSGESGFAIGQWMVAALTVGLSALYFSLEDDVNTSFD